MSKRRRPKEASPPPEPPPPAPARPSRRALTLLPWIASGLAVALFLISRAWALAPHLADEGIYFYGASRFARGVLPYRDFFHAHPPLHLLPNVALLGLFGWSPGLAKAPTFLLAAAQGVAAFLVVRRLARERGHAPMVADAAAAVALVLLLFAESFLKAAATDTGIAQAGGWLALSALALVYGRPVLAGLLAAAGPMTLLQSAPVALGIAVAAFARGGKPALLRFGAAAAGLVAALHAVFVALAGRAFIEHVYLFHLAKTDRPGEGARQLGFVIVDNWTLVVLAAVGAVALLRPRGPSRHLGAILLGTTLLELVAMATRPRVFPFYFQPAFFPLALLAGCGIAEACAAWTSARRVTLSLAGTALLLLTVLRWPLGGAISPTRASQHATYQQSYVWMDAPGIGPVNDLVRVLFWQDGVRLAGSDPNAVTEYLWQRSRWLDHMPALLEAVRATAQRSTEPSVFGDSTIAPLVAVEAGLSITGEIVDTNVERLRSGGLSLDEVQALLDVTPGAILVLGASEGIGAGPGFRAWVAARYERVAELASRTGVRHSVWRRR